MGPYGMDLEGARRLAHAVQRHSDDVSQLAAQVRQRIDELDLGHSITAGEIKLPLAEMKLITEKNAILAQIVIQLEEKVGEAADAVAGAAEPEVLTAKKPAEGEAAAAAPGAKDA